MGQSTSKCRMISDEEVLLYTKQYFTISAMVDILVRLENNDLPLLTVKDHAVDITKIVPYPPPNKEIYLAVFKPQEEIRGLDKPTDVYLTYLHKYNEFIMQNATMDPSVRKSRASEIRINLVSSMNELLRYITMFCGDIGIPETSQEQ